MLIKWMKTHYLNLGEALLFPRNQVIWLKSLKLWQAPTTVVFNIFFWNFAHVSVLPMLTKECVGFFKFYLDLALLINLVSVSAYKPGLFWIWQITQVLKLKKKIPHILLEIFVSRERVQSFNENRWSLWQLELVKGFNFLDKIPGFLKIIELCLMFVWD